MKIAIISFGSLATKGSNLVKTKFTNKNAPQLPIELCRISKSGKLVLAINEENGVSNNVFYAIAKDTSLNKVIPAFMSKENIGENQIGVVDLIAKVASKRANQYPNVSRNVAKWAKAQKIDAVVFNMLGRRFKDVINVPFSAQNAINYVNGQDAKTKIEQDNYLKSIPAGIDTPVLTLLKSAKAVKASTKKVAPKAKSRAKK